MSALAQLPRPVAFPVTVMRETVVVHVHLLDSTLHLGDVPKALWQCRHDRSVDTRRHIVATTRLNDVVTTGVR